MNSPGFIKSAGGCGMTRNAKKSKPKNRKRRKFSSFPARHKLDAIGLCRASHRPFKRFRTPSWLQFQSCGAAPPWSSTAADRRDSRHCRQSRRRLNRQAPDSPALALIQRPHASSSGNADQRIQFRPRQQNSGSCEAPVESWRRYAQR